MNEKEAEEKAMRKLRRSKKFYEAMSYPASAVAWIIAKPVSFTFIVGEILVLWVYYVNYIELGLYSYSTTFTGIEVFCLVVFGLYFLYGFFIMPREDAIWGLATILLPWYILYRTFAYSLDVPSEFRFESGGISGDIIFGLLIVAFFFYALLFMAPAVGRGGAFSVRGFRRQFVENLLLRKANKLGRKYGVRFRAIKVPVR